MDSVNNFKNGETTIDIENQESELINNNSQPSTSKKKKAKFDFVKDKEDFSKKLIVMPPDNKYDRERLIFYKISAYCVCPNCKQTVHTEISRANNYFTWISFVLLLIIFFPACWLPFVLDPFKDIVHTCPNCRTDLYHFSVITEDLGARDNFRGGAFM